MPNLSQNNAVQRTAALTHYPSSVDDAVTLDAADCVLRAHDWLLGVRNDLGLLAEEYDVGRKRQVGNFPQAFSHLTLILAARAISVAEGAGAQLATA